MLFAATLTALDLHGVDWPPCAATPNRQPSQIDSLLVSGVSVSSTPTEPCFHPPHVSTPTRANQQNKWKDRLLRILNVNFQPVDGKKASLNCLLDSMKPDIFLRTETWLDEWIPLYKILTLSVGRTKEEEEEAYSSQSAPT